MPDSSSLSFSQLGLPEVQLENLAGLGYAAMTPIQAQTLPLALQGADLIGQAETGSGKTVAFGLPIIQSLDVREAGIQALIVCPTRELCIQVSKEMRKLARPLGNITVVALYGGQEMALQKTALRNGAHIVVGTPGRIQDHLARETVSFGLVRTLVLDEADRMLEMGFLNDIVNIIATMPKSRQTLFFSATFPEDIRELSVRFQRSPVHIRAEPAQSDSAIDQKFILCEEDGKLGALAALLSHFQPESTMVFCNTKVSTKEVHRFLLEKGFSAATLHGDLEQRDREHVLMRFRHKSCRVLVATDVAARGLDIDDLSAVLNFEVPHDPETYVHRIGRTGRAGKSGFAFTLACPAEKYRMETIRAGSASPIPSQALATTVGRAKGVLVSDQVTLCIAAGRKEKLRAGDILGALTGEKGLDGKAVGRIDVMDYETFVSVQRKSVRLAFARLGENKIKGKKFRVRILD